MRSESGPKSQIANRNLRCDAMLRWRSSGELRRSRVEPAEAVDEAHEVVLVQGAQQPSGVLLLLAVGPLLPSAGASRDQPGYVRDRLDLAGAHCLARYVLRQRRRHRMIASRSCDRLQRRALVGRQLALPGP